MAFSQTFAPAEDVFSRLDTASTPSVCLAGTVYQVNPAINSERFSFSLTDVRIYHSANERETGAYMPWQGNGGIATGGSVDSYIKVNRRLTAWGAASFETHHQWDVRWNSALDYLRVAPYVLADSVGGNLSAQQYRFSGGVGYSLGKWTIGGEAAYRAEISYRRRDPRVKDVVSDLAVKIGASLDLGQWLAGLSGGVTIYNQEVDIDFYSPVNNIRTYCMTGIGSVYPRFSGGSTSNSAYEGIGYSGSVQLVQKSLRGVRFYFAGGKEEITQRVRDYNNLDLTKTETYTMSSTIQYSMPRLITFSISGGWIRRIGTENLFGTAIGNTYPKLSERQNYIADFAYGTFRLPVELSPCKAWRINITPEFGGAYMRQFLREPNRLLEHSYISPALSLGLSWRTSAAVRLSLDASGKRIFANTIADRLNGISAETERGQLVLTENALLSCCRTRLAADLRCDFKISSCPVFYLKGGYSTDHLGSAGRDNKFWSVAAGATF